MERYNYNSYADYCDINEFSADELKARLASAASMMERKYEKPVGCCRVYVEFKGVLKAKSKLTKVFESAGYKMFNNPQLRRGEVCIYVGYDNHSGDVVSRAYEIADALKQNQIFASVDFQGD